jgi:predicted double-glycine peptidase
MRLKRETECEFDVSVKLTLPMILILLVSVLVSLASIEPITVGASYVGKSAAISEVHLNVPFYYQEKDYYCGPAALQMVFNYYGENVSQFEIANVARTIGDPLYTTYADELRRAGQFSNMSTSRGDELPENITGYTLRSLGYAAFESQGMSLAALENFTGQGKPLILLMWYSSHHVSTHYRVVTGYNATHVFLHDPWNKPLWNGTYGGPNLAFNNSQFLDLWSYYDNWALYVSPWRLNVSMPAYVRTGAPFQVESSIVYPAPPPGALDAYPASSCNASITLPANLSLANGEVQMKKIGTGSLDAGTNSIVRWTLIANSSVTGNVSITADGMISGSVGPSGNYSAYVYSDRIGAAVDFRVKLKVDNSVPLIGKPSRLPNNNVEPDQGVKVSANVTDADSGVQNVTLFYTTDNGTTWQNRTMSFNESTSLYEATIPGQQAGTWVKFKILAFDRVGNNATYDGNEPYCTYQVLPEFPDFPIVVLSLAATLLAVIVYRRKRLSTLTLRNDESDM